MSTNGWIGVDLDGTLAQYDGWKGIWHIGSPVPAMLARVRQWIADGIEVRIFTARVCEPRMGGDGDDSAVAARGHIERWLEVHGLGGLAITNVKDFAMVELWDDRARQVEENTGRVATFDAAATIARLEAEVTILRADLATALAATMKGDTTTHVYPLGDVQEHTMSEDCWCGPVPDAVAPDLWNHRDQAERKRA